MNDNNQYEIPEIKGRHFSLIERFPTIQREVLLIWVVLLGIRFILKEVLGPEPDSYITSLALKILLILFRVVSLIILSAAAYSMGRFVRKFIIGIDAPRGSLFFSIALGLVCLSYITFFLLIRWFMQEWLLLIGALVLVYLVLRESGSLINIIKGSFSGWDVKSIKAIDLILVICILLVLAPPLLEVLTPPYSWDAQVYHLTIPRLYLDHGGIGYIPLNIYSNMPLNIDLLYVIALRFTDDVVAKMLHCALGLLLIGGMIGFSRHYLNTWRVGGLAALIFLSNPMINYEYGVAFIDVGMAFFVFMSFYATMNALDEHDRRISQRWMIISALMCGFVAGSKYTGIYNVAAIIALLIFSFLVRTKWNIHSKSDVLVRGGIIVCVITFLMLLPWLIKNAILTGNPVYPMLFNIFDGKDWSARMTEQLINWQHSIGRGRSLVDYLLLPLRVFTMSKYDYKYFAGPLCPTMAILFPISLLLCPRNLRRIFILLLVAYAGFFIPWSLGTQQVRFLLPAIPLIALTSGMVMGRPIRTIRDEIIAIGSALIVLGFAVHYNYAGLKINTSNIPMIIGQQTRGEFLATRVRSFTCYEYLEHTTNPDETIVLLHENMGYYLNRPFLADGMYETSYFVDRALELGDAESFALWLRRSRIRYVLVNQYIRTETRTAAHQGSIFSDAELNARFYKGIMILEDFIERYLHKEYSDYGTTVYYLTDVPAL